MVPDVMALAPLPDGQDSVAEGCGVSSASSPRGCFYNMKALCRQLAVGISVLRRGWKLCAVRRLRRLMNSLNVDRMGTTPLTACKMVYFRQMMSVEVGNEGQNEGIR